MAEVVKLIRKFEIEKAGKKIQIDDPNPEMSEEEVRKFLCATYPDLTNAVLYGPEIKNEVMVYGFKTSFAPKG